MSNLVLILILFGGVALLFAAGWLVSHLTKLDKEYTRMMDKGGNLPDADAEWVSEKTHSPIE